jgi:hypothetical protein
VSYGFVLAQCATAASGRLDAARAECGLQFASSKHAERPYVPSMYFGCKVDEGSDRYGRCGRARRRQTAERRSVDVRGATLQGGHLDYVIRWHSAYDELRRAPRTAPQLTTRCIFKRLRLVVCLPDGWHGSDLPIRISWNSPQTVRQRAVSA